ncbi:UNVERIFIED_CONTAM: hypothetical protein Slati_2130300 [Sesamum latifolium]|uniref:Reverse transcriptase domain-containing protein n=1 Tax=Sesamum latifolium TaxID=2727402 RepID=A0AAW2WTM8_9LAMI
MVVSQRIFLRLGFHHRFVKLIMLLVTSDSYTFMLNGELFEFLHPKRGIRQGDALSPYLFIFCAEALSLLMQMAENDGRLMGVAVTPEAYRVSHLLFADDTLVYCEANEVQLEEIRSILNRYEKASGQVINFQKSSMAVGGCLPLQRKILLAAILGVQLVPCHDRYLGLSASSGRSRGALFRDKLERRKPGINTSCGICGMQEESVKHVFLEFQFARQFWDLACFPWRLICAWNEGAVEWVSQIVQAVSEEEKCRFFTLCWTVWQNRCKKVMEDKNLDPMSAWRDAEVQCYTYSRLRSRIRVDCVQ